MKKFKFILLAASLGGGVALAILSGCSSLSTQTFNTLKLAEDSARAGVASWNTYSNIVFSTPGANLAKLEQDTAKVYSVSRQVGASIAVAEGLREAYTTNSAAGTQLTAILTTVSQESSNLVWLVNYLKNPTP